MCLLLLFFCCSFFLKNIYVFVDVRDACVCFPFATKTIFAYISRIQSHTYPVFFFLLNNSIVFFYLILSLCCSAIVVGPCEKPKAKAKPKASPTRMFDAFVKNFLTKADREQNA